MCGAFAALGIEMEKSTLDAFGERLGEGGGWVPGVQTGEKMDVGG